MSKEESKRIKKLEIEISYLRKELEELKKEKPVEIHTHYHCFLE